jgi:hypothetical protein
MKNFNAGDVYEIEVGGKLSYLWYTHEHPKYGSLLRLFASKYDQRPGSIDSILNDAVGFSCFLPLRYAKGDIGMTKIANMPVSGSLAKFPVFKTGLPEPDTHRIKNWWLWDGERSWQVGALTEEQKHFPARGIWNLDLLRQRIEENYTDDKAN